MDNRVKQVRKAIVVGATGAIGEALVKYLLASPEYDEITVYARKKCSFNSTKLVWHTTDFTALSALTLPTDYSHYFSCLGTTKKQAGSIEKQRQVDVNLQVALASKAKEADIKHCLLVSSYGANHLSKNSYLQMKGEVERSLEQLEFKQLTVVRPSLLLANRDQCRVGETLGALVLPWICKLPYLSKYRPIKVDVVAHKLMTLARSNNRRQILELDALF
ncbi:NAD(P)H-binding protein [Thalassotalea euphylliae]|uniref:NAD(P)H-binding protein n=1 Tax=Thalassotalea euphylliae TaxID=1655234 RepID=UPI0036311606